MKFKSYLFLFCLFFSISFIVNGAGDDDKIKGKEKSNVSFGQNMSGVSSSMQLQLDMAILKLEKQLSQNYAQTQIFDAMDNLPMLVSQQAENDRADAEKLMKYLDENPNKVKPLASVSFESLTTLPVGFSIDMKGNDKVTLGILEAKFFPTYAEVTIFARIQLTIEGTQRDIFFGVDGVKFTKGGFVDGGGFRAVLLGDYLIPGKKWTFKFRGGTSKSDRTYDNSVTYIDFDCNDFQEASISADVIFPRSVLLPYDVETGKAKPTGRVAFRLNQAKYTKAKGSRGMIASVSLNTEGGGPFCLPGFTKFGFLISNAIYDGSDIENASPTNGGATMKFPQNYQGDMGVTWTGFFLERFSVYLPKAFREPAKDDPSVTKEQVNTILEEDKLKFTEIGGTNIIIDQTGFSGSLKYLHNTGKDLRAQKWEYSLTGMGVEFVQNNFISGSFTGTVTTPLHNGSKTSGQLTYTGTIDPGDKYNLNIIVSSPLELEIKALRSKGKIFSGSWVNLEYVEDNVNGDKFYPSCSLSGEFSPKTKVKGGKIGIEATPIGSPESSTEFYGLKFYNLAFQTKDASIPYFSVTDFEYQQEGNTATSISKFGKFPVAITRLAKFKGTFKGQSPDLKKDLWIDFGFKVSLVKDKFGGAAQMLIKTEYLPNSGKLSFVDIDLESISIYGSTTAFDMAGTVEFYECPTERGFKGKLDLKIKKPFEVLVCAAANFGYDKIGDFSYGYIDAYAGSSIPGGGLPTGLGDLMINGLGAGLYFNMRPVFNGTVPITCGTTTLTCSNTSPSQLLVYTPDKQIPFGFKTMLGLTNVTKSFNARVSVDYALDRKFGINSITMFGSGTFTTPFLDDVITELESYSAGMNGMIKSATNDELQNFSEGNFSQADLVAKGKNFMADKDSYITTLNRKDPETGANYKSAFEGDVSFAIGIMLNVPQKTLHAEAEVFVDKGKLKGIGPNGRVGKAVLHIGKDDILGTGKYVFYLHAGRPTPNGARMGLTYQLNPTKRIGVSAYLMVGWGVPSFPSPPQRVLNYLELPASYFATSVADQNKIKEGTAIALGASAFLDFEHNINTKWRVTANADVGLDFLLSNNDTCKPGGGWLGRGQVYGYADAKLFKNGEKKQGASFGLLLRGNGLKPFGVVGAVAIEPPIIGFITGKVSIGVNVGNVCQP